MLTEITDEQALRAIENHEFDEDTLNSNKKVAIALTQSWCPQWLAMKGYLKKIVSEDPETSIFTLEYNKKEYFGTFMRMKESIWKNDQVPYIRFYNGGTLVDTANFISRAGFVDKLGK